jgi:hypothetical protein
MPVRNSASTANQWVMRRSPASTDVIDHRPNSGQGFPDYPEKIMRHPASILDEGRDIRRRLFFRNGKAVFAEMRLEALGGTWNFIPFVERAILEFGMELHAEGMISNLHRLASATVRLGEPPRPIRHLGHTHTMPFIGAETALGTLEKARAGALLRQGDIEGANLLRPLRPARAAKRIGKQLMAETKAEIGPLEHVHPMADGALFLHKPGMEIDVPDIHRPAKHEHSIEIRERRNGFIIVEIDGDEFRAASGQKAQKTTAALGVDVLKYQNPHGPILQAPA